MARYSEVSAMLCLSSGKAGSLFRLACACVGVKHSAEALEPVGYTHALAVLQTHRKLLGEPQALPQGTIGMHL